MLKQIAIREARLRQHNEILAEQVRKGAFDLRLAGKVIEHTSEGVMVTDCHNRIVSVNPAFTYITGYNADQVIGNTPKLLRSHRHDANFYKAMWTGIAHTGHWQGEVSIDVKTVSCIWNGLP